MTATDIDTVRGFNRLVTERVGALDESFLQRPRPLGASRVLWEIGSGNPDVRGLRARLGLDSGYLSRLLRSLEEEGLIEVAPDESDARVRAIRLTAEGHEEWEVLDSRSDQLAASFLDPLDASQKERLVAAMETVTRLLRAGSVRITIGDPATTEARFCIEAYFRELDTRFEAGFDPEVANRAAAEEMTLPRGLFLLATLDQEPVGCAGIKIHDGGVGEVKRMWVSGTIRGIGLGRRLLGEVERSALGRGLTMLRLDTNSALVEAVGLYRSSGYREIEDFNGEPYADLWFEKVLRPDPG